MPSLLNVSSGAPKGRGAGTAIKVEVLHGGKLLFDRKALQKILMMGGREVAATARSLVKRKLGARSKQKHVTSAPGSPPNSITGTLRKSIVTRAMKRKKLGARVIDTVFYAKFMETGAKGGGGRSKGKRKKGAPSIGNRVMLPHPFLSTAMNMKRSSIDARVKAAVNHGVSWVKEP